MPQQPSSTAENAPTPLETGSQEQAPFAPPPIEQLGLETHPNKELCHYTSQEGLIGILKHKSMYATDATYLNDSQEAVYAVSLATKYFTDQLSTKGNRFAQTMLSILGTVERLVGYSPVYVVSFSEEADLLSQWRGYCSKGSGLALCMSPDRMTKIVKAHRWNLFKCIYDEARQIEVLKKMEEHAISQCDENNFPPPEMVFGLVLLAYGIALKHPKFREEAEWRAIQSGGGAPSIRPGPSTLVPYMNFPLTIDEKDKVELSKLVVGPTPHAPLALRAAKSLLVSTNTICPDTISSEIPFRNW